MKLYLTSYRIPAFEALQELIGKNKPSVGIIPNAKDYLANRARDVKIRDITTYLEEQGFKAGTVDLREYSDPVTLEKDLKQYDALWVGGGNTFCLRYEMKRSGFDKIITPLIKKGLIYCGESAGACVAGTTLKGLETADNPEFAEEVIWEGLSLVPYIILPHADNLSFAEDNQYALQMHAGDRSLLKLNDDQAALIDGEELEILTGSRQ